MRTDDAPCDAPPIDRCRALAGFLAAAAAAVAGCSSPPGRTSTDSRSSTVVSPSTVTPVDPNPANSTTTRGTETAPTFDQRGGERNAELHALRRLSYGPTPAALDRVRTLGIDTWTDEQLEPDAVDTSDLDRRLSNAFPELAQPAPELVADYRADGNGARLFSVLSAAALVRHTTSDAQLFERLVEFWGDHFNAPQIAPPAIIARIEMDREAIRPHAIGRFDDLLVAVAQSPAMLRYLDNASSSVGAINENYARELLELHTVGVDAGYDEEDIVAVARLLTGWGHTRDLTFRFSPQRHDPGPVTVLGWNRPADDDHLAHGIQFLRHLATLPETARFVCHKLAVRFVADQPADELVDAMTATWVAERSAIGPVIKTMVGHAAFQQAPPKFNRPWDHYIQTLRSLNAELDVSSQRNVRAAIGAARDLGQAPFRWPSPDGYPDTESFWLDPGALLARWDVVAQLTATDAEMFDTDLDVLVEGAQRRTADDISSSLCERLCLSPVDERLRTVIAELTGWSPEHEPSDAEVVELVPSIIFVLLTAPSTLYR